MISSICWLEIPTVLAVVHVCTCGNLALEASMGAGPLGMAFASLAPVAALIALIQLYLHLHTRCRKSPNSGMHDLAWLYSGQKRGLLRVEGEY